MCKTCPHGKVKHTPVRARFCGGGNDDVVFVGVVAFFVTSQKVLISFETRSSACHISAYHLSPRGGCLRIACAVQCHHPAPNACSSRSRRVVHNAVVSAAESQSCARINHLPRACRKPKHAQPPRSRAPRIPRWTAWTLPALVKRTCARWCRRRGGKTRQTRVHTGWRVAAKDGKTLEEVPSSWLKKMSTLVLNRFANPREAV